MVKMRSTKSTASTVVALYRRIKMASKVYDGRLASASDTQDFPHAVSAQGAYLPARRRGPLVEQRLDTGHLSPRGIPVPQESPRSPCWDFASPYPRQVGDHREAVFESLSWQDVNFYMLWRSELRFADTWQYVCSTLCVAAVNGRDSVASAVCHTCPLPRSPLPNKVS
jgi:hypothetical protein